MLSALAAALGLGVLLSCERDENDMRLTLATGEPPALASAASRVIEQLSWRARVHVEAWPSCPRSLLH